MRFQWNGYDSRMNFSSSSFSIFIFQTKNQEVKFHSSSWNDGWLNPGEICRPFLEVIDLQSPTSSAPIATRIASRSAPPSGPVLKSIPTNCAQVIINRLFDSSPPHSQQIEFKSTDCWTKQLTCQSISSDTSTPILPLSPFPPFPRSPSPPSNSKNSWLVHIPRRLP